MINRKNTAIKIVLSALLLVVYAAAVHVVCTYTWGRPHMMAYRLVFVSAFFAFLSLHIFIQIEKLYGFIFRYRFLLAAIVFVVLVAAKVNLSNIGAWNYHVQPGEGSEFVTPIFGVPRTIRSDEWAVSLPRTLSYQFCAGEKYNDIFMGTLTPNLSTSHLYPSLSALATPFHWGYYLLGMEYGLSFYWCGIMLFTLLATNEFFLIISDRKKILSFMGACALTFSTFFLWWSSVLELTFGIGAVVFIWYFLHTEKRYQRILLGFGIAVSGSGFVCGLYPAWLVPFGYVYLALIIWCLVKNFDHVKGFKAWDWVIFALTVILAFAIIGVYMQNQSEYVAAVTDTVYPGKREVTGGFSLFQLFYYPASSKFFLADNGINASEYSSIFSFYPLPTILALYSMIKSRKKDLYMILLLCVSAVFTIYCTLGLPYIVAKLTLMTYSTQFRVIPVLGVIQIMLLIRSIALMEDTDCFVPRIPALLGALVLAGGSLWLCVTVFPVKQYIGVVYGIGIAVLIAFCAYGFMAKCHPKLRQSALILFIVFEMATGMMVLPIQKGADAIYSKPVAKAISAVVEEDPDAKWIVLDSWVIANFSAACGASTINSNNYMPNFELWHTLFDQEEYEANNDIFNRYAHIEVQMVDGETSLELLSADLIKLNLSYEDLDKLGVEYVVSLNSLEDSGGTACTFRELYSGSNMYVYEVVY